MLSYSEADLAQMTNYDFGSFLSSNGDEIEEQLRFQASQNINLERSTQETSKLAATFCTKAFEEFSNNLLQLNVGHKALVALYLDGFKLRLESSFSSIQKEMCNIMLGKIEY